MLRSLGAAVGTARIELCFGCGDPYPEPALDTGTLVLNGIGERVQIPCPGCFSNREITPGELVRQILMQNRDVALELWEDRVKEMIEEFRRIPETEVPEMND